MNTTGKNTAAEDELPGWSSGPERAYRTWPKPPASVSPASLESSRAATEARQIALAMKAARARSLTDPLGAKGQRTMVRSRLRGQLRARRAIFLASLATFAACFGLILKTDPAHTAAQADPAATATATIAAPAATRRVAVAPTATAAAGAGSRAGAVGTSTASPPKPQPTATATSVPTPTPAPHVRTQSTK